VGSGWSDRLVSFSEPSPFVTFILPTAAQRAGRLRRDPLARALNHSEPMELLAIVGQQEERVALVLDQAGIQERDENLGG
jgi:hypothetical protein